MKVINKEMLHITKENKWKIGDVITSGVKENPFWLFYQNYSLDIRLNQQPMSIFEMFEQSPDFDVTQNNIDFLYDKLKIVSKEFSFYVREHVFEEVRKEHFPQLPSRLKCLWITEETQLPYWRTMSIDKKQYLLTVVLDGNIFCADEYWLKANTFSRDEYYERANHYWSEEMSKSPKTEFLFYGNAIIKRVTDI